MTSELPTDARGAERELQFIREVVDRTHRHMDPHAFHFVHWGALVLVWYPLANWFQLQGNLRGVAATGIVAVTCGFVLSGAREMILKRRPRLPAENTFITRQVVLITFASLAAGGVLSAVGPGTGFVAGENVPILWGLVYAVIAFMTGVAYNRDFLWAGVFIFAGVVLAILNQPYNGYILGPFMGLGMIVPGLRAERRIRRLVAEARDDLV